MGSGSGTRWEERERPRVGGSPGHTSIIGVCPFTPTFSFVFEITTSKSLPLRLPGTGTVMSRSPIVCVHL